MANQHIQHMHKALTQMNLQRHHGISDLTGVTGLAMVDAILAGARDPIALAKLRDPRVKADEETIRKSLVGNWRDEHLFTLKQSREMYRRYQEQMVACDQEIERMLGGFAPRVDPEEKPLPPDRKRNRSGKKRRKKKRRPESGLRSAHRSLQAVRRGCDTDPGVGDDGPDLVQRTGAGHVALGHGGVFCVLAGPVSGLRHQPGPRAVEGNAPGP
jgi:hypothetical protein